VVIYLTQVAAPAKVFSGPAQTLTGSRLEGRSRSGRERPAGNSRDSHTGRQKGVYLSQVNNQHTTDLFSAGITTSSRGDWYLAYQTFQGGDRVPPLKQGVVYRTAGATPSYIGATIQQNIDPGQWLYFNSALPRCAASPCYTAGDFFRPTMNTYTSAAIPRLQQPLDPVNHPDLNDVVQAFVQDPPSRTLPQFLPNIVPFEAGSDLSGLSAITPELIQQSTLDRDYWRVSPMIAEELRHFGHLN